MPDADPEMTARNVLACDGGLHRPALHGGVGHGGGVEDRSHRRTGVAAQARQMMPGKDLGPVITQAAKDRIERYIDEAEQAGATVLVDGRRRHGDGQGRRLLVCGPTVIDARHPDDEDRQGRGVRPGARRSSGPRTLDEALAVENASPYGNAASIFTESGGAGPLRRWNGPAPAWSGSTSACRCRASRSRFGGWNESKFGVGDITGKSSIEFWTQTQEDHHQVEPGSRDQLDVAEGETVGTAERGTVTRSPESPVPRSPFTDRLIAQSSDV